MTAGICSSSPSISTLTSTSLPTIYLTAPLVDTYRQIKPDAATAPTPIDWILATHHITELDTAIDTATSGWRYPT